MSKTVLIRASSKLSAILLALLSTSAESWEVSYTCAEYVGPRRWRVTVVYHDPEDPPEPAS